MTSPKVGPQTPDPVPDDPRVDTTSDSVASMVARAIDRGELAALAGRHEVDPCAVVGEAAPALALGDLTEGDEGWVREHAVGCPECTDDLRNARSLDEALGRLSMLLEPLANRQTPLSARRSRRTRSVVGVADRARIWTLETPVGGLYLAVSNAGVCEVDFAATTSEPALLARLRSRGFAPELIVGEEPGEDVRAMSHQFAEYFGGRRRRLDLPVDLAATTAFTRTVLEATASIPFGEIATYGTIAARIGQPTASRAVGNALGRNPVPLIVPCHRVVRSDLSYGGFVGGTSIKQRLLHLEGAPPAVAVV